MDREKPSKDNRNILFILGTGAVLIFCFLVLIAAFFLFSNYSNGINKCVAVVTIDNEIDTRGTPSSLFSSGTPGSEEIAKSIESINKRDDVASVLFVIDSPGGSVVATREIYDSVKSLNKPKVSYFREVAASGAFYVSMGTDYIISDPDAITGSIGVIATFTDLSGLMEKVGVNVTPIKSATHKDIGSPYRKMTDDEKTIIQEMIDEVYKEFRSIVLQNRQGKINPADFDKLADGRILSGRQAAAAGLIDQVGSKKDAILKAAQMGEIDASSVDDVRLCYISTGSDSGGSLNLDSFVKKLSTSTSLPKLSYR